VVALKCGKKLQLHIQRKRSSLVKNYVGGKLDVTCGITINLKSKAMKKMLTITYMSYEYTKIN
jgi:hypothetical protein